MPANDQEKPQGGDVESAEDILEDAPCAFLSARMDGTIIKVNAKLIGWTGKSRSQLVGKTRIQELFPRGEQIYFETHVRPLLLMQGHVKEIACHLVRGDGTTLPVFLNGGLKKDGDGTPQLLRVALFDATDRVKYEQELRLRRHQADELAAVVNSSTDAIVSMGLDLVVRSWNKGARDLFGYSAKEALGQPIDSLIIPESKREERGHLQKMLREGHSAVLLETERAHKNGNLVPVELRASPIRDLDNRVTGISVIYRDITERRRAQNKVDFVLKELNHRTKNLMGVIQSIARLSGKGGDLDSFRSDFSARLGSLAANQDLLLKFEWRSVALGDLVHRHIAPFCQNPDSQLVLNGPHVELLPNAAQSLGMALHELGTNAVKYGSLGKPDGQVFISWMAGPQFEFEWKETGGPAVQLPARTGFGSTVLKAMIEGATKGAAEMEFHREGLRWTLAAAAEEIVHASDASGSPAQSVEIAIE